MRKRRLEKPTNMDKKILDSRSAGLTQRQKDGIYDHCRYDVEKFCPKLKSTNKN